MWVWTDRIPMLHLLLRLQQQSTKWQMDTCIACTCLGAQSFCGKCPMRTVAELGNSRAPCEDGALRTSRLPQCSQTW